MKQDIKNVVKVLLAILLGLWVCWLLSGCSPKVIEIEKPVIVEQTHTQTHTDIVRDTLVWRDSIYHYVKGDTVIIEKWHHTQQVNKWVVTDTVRDTIPRIVTVVEKQVQEVNHIYWWQKALMWAGVLALLLGGGAVAWKFYKP